MIFQIYPLKKRSIFSLKVVIVMILGVHTTYSITMGSCVVQVVKPPLLTPF